MIWSVHCHNDLAWLRLTRRPGLAGARQAEVTINGTASARQHVARRSGDGVAHPALLYNLTTGIDTTQIAQQPHGQQLHRPAHQPNKVIVGANAFSHEAGIHQDGVLKHQATYEIMTPETGPVAEQPGAGAQWAARLCVRLEDLG